MIIFSQKIHFFAEKSLMNEFSGKILLNKNDIELPNTYICTSKIKKNSKFLLTKGSVSDIFSTYSKQQTADQQCNNKILPKVAG